MFLIELGLEDRYPVFQAAGFGSLKVMLDERCATNAWLLAHGGLSEQEVESFREAAKAKIKRSPALFRTTQTR